MEGLLEIIGVKETQNTKPANGGKPCFDDRANWSDQTAAKTKTGSWTTRTKVG